MNTEDKETTGVTTFDPMPGSKPAKVIGKVKTVHNESILDGPISKTKLALSSDLATLERVRERIKKRKAILKQLEKTREMERK